MELESLKSLAIAEPFGAITLDTSIIYAQGLRLESGLLKQLSQFRYSAIDLIVSEVVKEEVISHLVKNAKDAEESLEASLKRMKRTWLTDQACITNIKKLAFGSRTAERLSRERFKQFSEAIGLEIVEAQDYVKVDDLLRRYFSPEPPFADTGKKKNEFPDAIALLSLAAWAQEHEAKVIVLTTDEDWNKFCRSSKRLVATKDLTAVLELFQSQRAEGICNYLSQRYKKGHLKHVKKDITDSLTSQLNDSGIDIEASSSFYYEQDDAVVNVNEFEFQSLHKSNPTIFRPVNFDDEELVVASKLVVSTTIECSFSFYVYDSIDKDEVPIGGTNVVFEKELDVDVLIHFIGDWSDADVDVEVDDVEVDIQNIPYINIDEISPDYED